MEEYSQTQQIAPHGTPFLRIAALLFFALLIALISSLTTYYFLNKQSQTQLESYQQMNVVQITPIPTQPLLQNKDNQAIHVYDFSGLIKLINPNSDGKTYVQVEKTAGNFTLGTMITLNGNSGYRAIWKNENGAWKGVDESQQGFSCKTLIDNKVPPELVSVCRETEEFCKEYQKGCSDPKKTNGEHNYHDLYQEKFGM